MQYLFHHALHLDEAPQFVYLPYLQRAYVGCSVVKVDTSAQLYPVFVDLLIACSALQHHTVLAHALELAYDAEEWVVLKFMYSFLVAYQSLTVVFGQFIVSVVHQHFFQYFA